MSDFTIQFNRVQEVTGSLHECHSSLNGYKGSLDTFIEGSAESIWNNSCDAAEKIVDHIDAAYNAVKDTKDYICDQVSNLFSSLW